VISAGAYEFSVEAAITLLKGNLPAGFSDRPLLERTRTLEIKTLLHSALLGSQSDRVLMASGVEGRYPFLDSSVVSFGERCEWDDLFDGDWSEKRSLREAVTGLLPDEIRIRPKQAYAAPTSALLRSTAGIAIFEDLLSTLDGVALDWIQPGALLWLVARLKDGRPLSTYDEIAILWFASLAVLI
jgi:asparagine synthase (glutamine-hydrolysing)